MRELRLPHNAKLKQGRDNSVHMLLKPEISHEWFITRYQILKLTITYLGLALWEWLLIILEVTLIVCSSVDQLWGHGLHDLRKGCGQVLPNLIYEDHKLFCDQSETS